MKAVIFGANGQDGLYLRQVLKREKIEAVCVSRSGEGVIGDVADWNFVERLIKTHAPEFVFHLAANSTTRHNALFANHAAISTGTVNILEAVHRHCRHSKVFLSGSAMQFENNGVPIDENTAFAPLSAYAVSRIHSVYAGRYFRELGVRVYVGYFFNHDSPQRSLEHINQRIATAAKNVSKGSHERIEIGDVTVKKEFNYAGDIVDAVWQLVSQDHIFEAVIGCGEAHAIEEWLELCFANVNLKWTEHVRVLDGFTPEYQILISEPALIRSLGWRPKVRIKELAGMMMEV